LGSHALTLIPLKISKTTYKKIAGMAKSFSSCFSFSPTRSKEKEQLIPKIPLRNNKYIFIDKHCETSYYSILNLEKP
jgi:hypothetical protein